MYLMENGFTIQSKALSTKELSVHFLATKSAAKGMEGQISCMRNGVGRPRGVKFQGELID